MDHQNPFHGDSHNPFSSDSSTESPIPVDDFTVNGSQVNGSQRNPQSKKKFSTKIIVLCLVCALLGGAVGGATVHLVFGGSSSNSIYSGNRDPIKLDTVSVDTKEQLTVPEVYANYVDSCVGITVDIVSTNFFGQTVTGAAAGSGFVITEDGYILTNYHVIGNANAITVTFSDDRSYSAQYIGSDQENDVAIIKIEATGLKPVVFGNSNEIYVGETVVTIGNPLGELTFSLSDGVVSALDRLITMSDGQEMNMLQTNCTINSGNSGGPLFNLNGEVIGIVSAKYSSSQKTASPESEQATVEGLGFAIPINDVRDMISDLIDHGYVTGRPYLGIFVQPASVAAENQAGAQIVYAAPDLPAFESGLQEGDIITAVDDISIADNKALIETIDETYKAGDTANFSISRNGESMLIPVTFGEKNEESTRAFETYTSQREMRNSQGQQQLPSREQTDPSENNGGFSFPWPFS